MLGAHNEAAGLSWLEPMTMLPAFNGLESITMLPTFIGLKPITMLPALIGCRIKNYAICLESLTTLSFGFSLTSMKNVIVVICTINFQSSLAQFRHVSAILCWLEFHAYSVASNTQGMLASVGMGTHMALPALCLQATACLCLPEFH